MAPMTRCRAINGNAPGPLAVTYYVQRATAGLIITEGSQVSPQGVGFFRTPGIHTEEQVAGWKQVTAAVHRVGENIPPVGMRVACRTRISWMAASGRPSALPVGEEIHTP